MRAIYLARSPGCAMPESAKVGVCVLMVLASSAVSGCACAPTQPRDGRSLKHFLEKPRDVPSTEAALKHFLEKSREVVRLEVDYEPWENLMLPINEASLLQNSWTYKSTIRFPHVTQLAETLAAMKLEPLEVPPQDFRLGCVLYFYGDSTEPLTLSFGKYPAGMSINGKAFKPSWRLVLLVSEFVPFEAHQDLLEDGAEDLALPDRGKSGDATSNEIWGHHTQLESGISKVSPEVPRSDAPAGSHQTVQYSGEGFRLNVPSAVSIRKTERADYIVYDFISEGKSFLHAYVGNQPTFLFDDRAVGPESIAELNGLPCKRAQVREKDGALRTELLVRFPRDRGWPMYIHFWHGSLTPDANTMVEAIIASLTPQTQGTERSSFTDSGGPDFPPVRRRSEDIIADMERKLEQMKKQQGMTEEVRRLEADLKMRKDLHRSVEEDMRMAREEPEKWRQKQDRIEEEVYAASIAGMERDLEEMKKRPGTTEEEVKEFEVMIAKFKEDMRLRREKARTSSERERQ